MPKKKSWKNGHFSTKAMGYPVWNKIQFSTFWTSGFCSLERRFFVLEYRKRYFSCLYWLKKKMLEKWPLFDQNHGLTRLEKCHFFDFLNFLFLLPRKALFRCKYRKRHFLGLYCLKKKCLKNGHFRTKTMGNFSTFWTSFFFIA